MLPAPLPYKFIPGAFGNSKSIFLCVVAAVAISCGAGKPGMIAPSAGIVERPGATLA